MAVEAYDITTAILNTFVQELPFYLNEGMLPTDPDFLETVEKGPLQDDPTARATYLVVEPDYEATPDGYRVPVGSTRKNKLHEPEAAPKMEIGGGFLMINYFRVGGWVPQHDSKESVYDDVGRFGRRLERSIQQIARRVLPQGVTTSDGLESTMGLLQVFNLNGTTCKLIGGESEWYGKVWVKFAVYTQVNNEYWK